MAGVSESVSGGGCSGGGESGKGRSTDHKKPGRSYQGERCTMEDFEKRDKKEPQSGGKPRTLETWEET